MKKIESDALKANLRETAVEEVVVAPEMLVLSEIVADMKGIRNSIDNLLYEVHHPYRNWNLIIPRLRAFVLKNAALYQKHDRGPEAFSRFTDIFFKALDESRKNHTLLGLIMESQLAYIDKIVTMDPASITRFAGAFADCFDRLFRLDDRIIMFMVQGRHPMKKIASFLLDFSRKNRKSGMAYDLRPVGRLMQRVLILNYEYWLAEDDPLPWFFEQCDLMCHDWHAGRLFNAVSHAELRKHLAIVKNIDIDSSPDKLADILKLPAHMDLVRLYREIPEKLSELQQKQADTTQNDDIDRFAENRKLFFLFRIMNTRGLYLIHEDTLREINRSLVNLIRRQTFEEIKSFLLTTLQLLKANVRRYPHTSMQCIQVLGTEVFKRGNSRLVETFLWEVVRFGFQYANVIGVDEDWQPITNPAHLANIRVWLNLIMQEPKWCSILFSALIINLHISGTCVKDTDLFQRDITKLLNHPIEPVYNLVKQFAKIMPVFFNEIGAEGQLREVSTEIDEIHKRQDFLIHFLRKQSHVESSNLIVGFIQAIIVFWQTRDKKVLKEYLPDEVLSQISVKGLFIDDLHVLVNRAFALEQINSVNDLLDWDQELIKGFLDQQRDLKPVELKRFFLLIRMYKLLDQKYNLSLRAMRHQLEQAIIAGFPEMEQLLTDLETCDTFHCLTSLLAALEKLKTVILSPDIFEVREDIYYKRHIAVDIPSVYGRYSEKKFDALGLTFRLEGLANIYLEKLPATVNLSFITKATFLRIVRCLRLYIRALEIDGIVSRRLDTYVSLLTSSLGIKRFSYTQYLDICRGLSEGVKDVIYAYYTNIHQNNLSIIIPQIGPENLLAKYRNLWHQAPDNPELPTKDSVHSLSEAFLRDLIATTFGLQHLDNFITRISQTLEQQREVLDEKSLDLLMSYNPEKVIHLLHQRNPLANNLILLGNKGYNLTLLSGYDKPVPPGFIITTEIFRCRRVVRNFFKARDEFMQQVRHSMNLLEKRTGRIFGDPDNPLLVSVRSGAAISMPGMMATIHNVGLNQDIVEGFATATGKEYLAWDNYRRFLQSWAMTMGLEREIFQRLMDEAKARYKVTVKSQFTAAHMKELALNYQRKIDGLGINIPDDPWRQLTGAVEMVLRSWDAPKTRGYRSLMDVSDSWGTAVIIQAMVFGNLSRNSGSGVVFTAHPYRKVRRVALWGDYACGDQGEDIVGGLVTTYPISIEQAEIDGRPVAYALEEKSPEIYKELLEIARDLVYEKRWNPQEIEFTFEGPKRSDLYILQTRDMITIKKKERFHVFTDKAENSDDFLGKGIGVSGSALSGRAVFSEENINALRREDPDSPLILIRQDTVPEDIREISLADGLLTARGGQTSHAAVVTLRLEKTCVVGCRALHVYETGEYCLVSGHKIKFGDPISIDGRKGLFLKGVHPTEEQVHILPI